MASPTIPKGIVERDLDERTFVVLIKYAKVIWWFHLEGLLAKADDGAAVERARD
ncbi:hypothetical protein [Methylococcus sp. EFPC2]|uniref:hypothetical protein n=1 Tax=Methylococcus sp. EFPC2 TaxID=2812648 RepID=UPI00196761F1|nr:hypothetical protein [Methylococcus sp. EFPC2]QSA98289.1 hypothetical protein JWZ97_05600 [Methylococcus sp. EFPC2]